MDGSVGQELIDFVIGKGSKYYPNITLGLKLMADIRAEPAMVKSFVFNIIEVRHLSEFHCIDPNDSLE